MRWYRFVSLTLLVIFLTGGCALVKLREDVQFSKDSCLLFGEIISKSPIKNLALALCCNVKDWANTRVCKLNLNVKARNG